MSFVGCIKVAGGVAVALLIGAGCGGGGGQKPDAGPVDAPIEQVIDAHDAGDTSDAPVDMPTVDATNDAPAGDAPVDAQTDAPPDIAADVAAGEGGSNDARGVVTGFWENPYVCERLTSPQGPQSFTVGADGTIAFSTAKPDSARSVSPDGTMRAEALPAVDAGVPPAQIRITRVADSSVVATLGTESMPARLPLAWSPDGTRLVTGGRGGTLYNELLLWKTSDWTIERSIVTDNDLNSVRYAPDGRSLLTNGSNESVVLDAATGLRRLTFPLVLYSGCITPAMDVAYSPDGALAATSTSNGTLIWSTVDGHMLARLPSYLAKQVEFTKFGIVTLDPGSSFADPVIATRWCPGAAPGDGGVAGDGGIDAGDASSGADGGVGVGTCMTDAFNGLTRGDFDGDGIDDCVRLNPPDVSFYKGLAASVFATTPVVTRKVLPPGFTGVSNVVDMTGDGRQDLVYFANAGSTPSNPTYGYVAVGRLDGTFGSTCSVTGTGIFYASGKFTGAGAGDFTSDGKTDILGMNITGAPAYGEPIVFSLGRAGAGSGETGYPMKVSFGMRGTAGIGAAADIDGDGYRDTFIISLPADILGQPAPNEAYVAWGNGTGKLFSRTPTVAPIAELRGVQRLTTGEFNGDGKLDLLVSFDSNPPSLRYLGDGAGNFTPAP